MAIVERTPQAQADLEAILEALDASSPRAADRFAEAVDKRSEALGRFPEMGRPREEIAPRLRSVLVGQHVLFYRIREDVVELLRILHGRRDLRRIMRDEFP